ncbi:MAG TPA: hypothetical protein VK469_16730, partial [Candidatus Kapabacteria bacterium]|nr:hypothetical protein [Candidatus Kapabacteria bacterium]
MNKSLQEQSPECLHEYWGGSCKSCGKPHPNFKSTQEPSKSTQELIEEKINGVNDEFSNGRELIELCTNEEIDGVLLKIKNYLR